MSKISKIILIAIFVGLLSGALSSLFLHSLDWVTSIRIKHPVLIWGLPFWGLFLGAMIKRIPHHINQGVPYILHELENPKANVSPWMTPFIFIASLGSHIFGGSVGREGVGVIMGASSAHLFSAVRLPYEEMRPVLIYSGIAAGFSSIFGTPIAAILFAFELHKYKHLKSRKIFVCTAVASFVAFYISRYLAPSHMNFNVDYEMTSDIFFYLLIATLTSGIGGLIFYWSLKSYTKFISKIFPHIELKLFMGGLLVSTVVFISGGHQFIGIGTDVIAQAFVAKMVPYDFAMKCLLTVMTISVGFKGGEVTPLFYMGSTFSNSIASFFNFSNYGLSSSLGMVGLFSAVTATPVASAIMGAELFGPKVGALCLISCILSRMLMRKHSVYRL